MRVVFYSKKCEYSNKLIAYLEKNNIKNLFEFINIDETEPPDYIDLVPTIVDTKLNQPMKGKKAFEYLLNLKYFNNPTNNIEYIKELPTNPDIPEDDKAIQSKTQSLELSSSNNINNETNFNDLFINSEQKSQNIQNNKLAILMKIKKNR
jgi:hypothetical protein